MATASAASATVTGWVRRIAAAPHAPAVGGGLLAVAAVAEAGARAAQAPAGTASVVGGGALYALTLCLLALATTIPLIFLRPAAAGVAITVASTVSVAASGTLTIAGLAALLIASYRLGRAGVAVRWGGAAADRTGARRDVSELLACGLAAPFLAIALAGRANVAAVTPAGPRMPAVLLAALVCAAAWAGIAHRARGEAARQSADRTALADTLFEHLARGERARIARELHDVVAHHISMIAVRAETARLTTPGLPPAGAERLREIGDTARAGLTEMRRLLGVLRTDADPDAVTELHPQPGLPQLNSLIDAARAASGAGVRLIVSGPVASFDPGIELAAYRIVQEALTNARRHAPGAAVDVELRYAGNALRLRIRDNGPGPDPRMPGRGHGLPGMRERAAAAGGSLRAGAAAGGGFLVEAALPSGPVAEPAAGTLHAADGVGR